MIQSNTLRIGNLVRYQGEVVEIIGIPTKYHVAINKDLKEGLASCEDLEPIQITEELLQKSSLKLWNTNEESNTIWFWPPSDLYKTIDLGEYNRAGGNIHVLIKENLKYLHDLQNCIKSITGKELTLKDL